MATTQEDVLAGITSRTPKEDLMRRLRRASEIIQGHQSQELKKLEEVSQRVKAKYQGRDFEQLRTVIVSATEEEWKQTTEFLEEFGDILPTSLQRVLTGHKTLAELQK